MTIDAMGCQSRIAKRIEKKVDYLLSVKENQPSLCEAIGDAFLDAERERFGARFADYAEQSNARHGRTEQRRCWVSRDKKLIESLGTDRAGLCRIVVIESDRAVAGKPSTSDRKYYISSRAETAEYFLAARRAHWQIENGLHWVLDVAFREDESRVRKGDGAENVSVLKANGGKSAERREDGERRGEGETLSRGLG